MARKSATPSKTVITHLQILGACVRGECRTSPECDPIELIDEYIGRLGLESPRSVSVMETARGRVYAIRNCTREFLIVPQDLVTRRSGRSRLRQSYASCLTADDRGIIFENNEHPMAVKRDGCVVVSLQTLPKETRRGPSVAIAKAVTRMRDAVI